MKNLGHHEPSLDNLSLRDYIFPSQNQKPSLWGITGSQVLTPPIFCRHQYAKMFVLKVGLKPSRLLEDLRHKDIYAINKTFLSLSDHVSYMNHYPIVCGMNDCNTLDINTEKTSI